MREAQKHVRAWQSSQLKTIMSKPFKRNELEKIWEVPKRRKQIELDVNYFAKALSELYTDSVEQSLSSALISQ